MHYFFCTHESNLQNMQMHLRVCKTGHVCANVCVSERPGCAGCSRASRFISLPSKTPRAPERVHVSTTSAPRQHHASTASAPRRHRDHCQVKLPEPPNGSVSGLVRCALLTTKSGNVFRVGIFLGFGRRSGTTRTEGPHGGASYVRGAKRNRIGPPLGWNWTARDAYPT